MALGPQTIRLRPAPHARASILSYSLTLAPREHTLQWYQDPAANFLARAFFPAPVTSLQVDVELEAEIGPSNAFDFIVEPEVATWPFRYPEGLRRELTAFTMSNPPGPGLVALEAEIPGTEQPTVAALTQLARLVSERIAYRIRLEPGVQSPEETLASRAGSCRDSAWLLVELLRRRGFAARFVSGYLIELIDAPGADRASLHAWAEAYLPGAGWIGLDSTSGLLTGEAHVPLAASASPASAAPLSGTVEQDAAAFEVTTTVARLAGAGDPRPPGANVRP